MPKNKPIQKQDGYYSIQDLASSLCAHPKLQKWNLRVKPMRDDDNDAFMQHLKHIASKAK